MRSIGHHDWVVIHHEGATRSNIDRSGRSRPQGTRSLGRRVRLHCGLIRASVRREPGARCRNHGRGWPIRTPPVLGSRIPQDPPGSGKHSSVRDDQIRSRLVQSNPWWRTAAGGDRLAWTADDRALRSRVAFDLGYRPEILADIALGPIGDGLVVLRGPRRVGKSVTVKDAVTQLCGRRDVDPRQIVYLAADGMTAQDLNRVAVLGRDLTRSVDPARRIWLLDEVTGVKGWTETIKFLRDNTRFGDDTVVCTGSSWDAEAEVERDLFAGRAGTATTRRSRLLLPMRFCDVLAATGRDVPSPGSVPPWDLQGPAAAAAAAAAELAVDDLDLAWQAYLTSGGFPRAVAEHHRTGQVGDAFLTDLAAWLHQDVDPEASADSVPLLLAGLHQRSGSPLNRAATASALSYRTRQTFDLRLTRLTRSFAALWCHQVDDDGRRVVGAQSKLYLTDPLLAWLGPRLRAGVAAPDLTILTEAALGVALAQAVDRAQPGRWAADDAIGFLRTGGGNEIDFAPIPVPTAAATTSTTPLESKWVTHGWRSEARVVQGKLGRGVLATRTIVDTTTAVWALPAPLVALLLS